MLTINEIETTGRNAELVAKDLEPGDGRRLAAGCLLAYTMSGHEAYIIRAQCYLAREGVESAEIDAIIGAGIGRARAKATAIRAGYAEAQAAGLA